MSTSRKFTTSRRALARVAVAGALVAVPLSALAVPASAETSQSPSVTEVSHPRYDRNCGFGPFDNWRCDNGPFDQWNNRGPFDQWNHHRGYDQGVPWWWLFQQNQPRGLFGSS
ncbi:hypothetical protein [Nocardia callitridis]|uniref:Uncharacterized protein n=1 Tax=Nocardia callitridis TaxID=648753 RepID=A0ABP9KNB5_9NOCA